ncbi:Protein-S-isoprenylcysteine O-methyltransferase Ste14 [Neorhodopirellula lusitana]|uniref:Protein-S-isoprenylcysteine O-methyltransferase Ste14 n=1 Tax=Neorhodopirellula lusitana TaxID=445327 RepID=A0ABY1Q4L6_9BACT|nr:methyltransferase [Neorhodopirellula lusitana]SMP59555.1 Protein-S-isoprenylcysteine O-methyltransferase Ste14 [Neorhodopirellula lusitana]
MFLWFLVTAQFVLAALLVLSSRWTPIPWLELLIAAPGIVLAVSAWLTMGLRRVRVHPGATAETKLTTCGPYSIVRHPMYVGLLWFTAALLPSGFAWWRLVSWFALVLVLQVKTIHEERSMARRFAEYAVYQQQVGRLVPRFRSVFRFWRSS